MKVISCSEAISRMFEFLEGVISAKQKAGLDEHLNVCRDCCDRFEFEELLKDRLSAISAQEKAPQDLVKKIRNMVDEF